jgi:hypothetical protein
MPNDSEELAVAAVSAAVGVDAESYRSCIGYITSKRAYSQVAGAWRLQPVRREWPGGGGRPASGGAAGAAPAAIGDS